MKYRPYLFFCILLLIGSITACTDQTTIIRPYVSEDKEEEEIQNIDMFIKRLEGVSSGSLVILPDEEYPDIGLPQETKALVICLDTKEVLFSQQALMPISAKNFTKLMTAYLVFNHNSLSADRSVTITQDIFGVKNDLLRCKFTKDDVVTVTDLLYGLLLYCGNDAAIPLAIASSGSVSQFVRDMNETAKLLSLNHSTYSNVYGYPTNNSKQETTLYDTYVLMRELLNSPLFCSILSAQTYGCRYTNHNGEPASVRWESALPYYHDLEESVLPEGLTLLGGICENDDANASQMILYFSGNNNLTYLAFISDCVSYSETAKQMQYIINFLFASDNP